MTKLRFAIIGFGQIGQRHAAMINSNPDTELVALIDTADLNERLIRAGLTVPVFKTLEDLWQSEIQFEVLTVATPNGLHALHACSGLRAGKHIVVEKPMALTEAEAESIVLLSKILNLHVFTVMQNRYSPPAQWLRQVVDSGKLGKILLVQLNCFWNRDARYYQAGGWHGTKNLDGGTLFTQFSHFIDIMYWLFGDIDDIHSTVFDLNHQHLTEFEDSGFVNFRFVQGGYGTLNFSTSVWDKNLESSMTVLAENGSVQIGGQYMERVTYCHIKNYELPVLAPSQPGNDYGSYQGSAQNHHFVVQNVVDVLRKQKPITTTAEEGKKVVEIINRIYSAAGNALKEHS